MKYVKRVGFLKGLLSIIGSFVFLMLILSISSSIALMDDNGVKKTIRSILFSLLFFGGYFMIILSLKKILNSISEKNPFIIGNIIYLRRIGYYILSIGVIDAIISYPESNNTGLDLLATSYGSLNPIFFLYLSLSLLAFILSDVFKMAMDVKKENVLTI